MMPPHPIFLRFFSVFLLFPGAVSTFAQQDVVADLRRHVEYLSSDDLKGRSTGSAEEKLAAGYIAREFEAIGLEPGGDSIWFQPFGFPYGKAVGGDTYMKINGIELVLGRDYFPLSISGNGAFSGSLSDREAMILSEDDLRSKAEANPGHDMILVADYHSLTGASSTFFHHDPHGRLRTFCDLPEEERISAVFFLNLNDSLPDPAPSFEMPARPCDIPLIFVSGRSLYPAIMDGRPHAEGMIALEPVELRSMNVVGYLDNRQPYTVVIGAHYDHLGLGERGSLSGKSGEIHNGADDNASGVAGLIELARALSGEPGQLNNYLFIGFSGEELGLMGSRHFTASPTVDSATINYMINLDMVGRMDTADPRLIINGVGTSPAWTETIGKVSVPDVSIVTTSSGSGPSDHTSFYNKRIPALHYFTGVHSDYHRPSDDAGLINYTGLLKTIMHIRGTILLLNDRGRLDFTTTGEDSARQTPKFKVTLGLMPDYTYQGEGLRVESIIPDRPADEAGLRTGDVIIRLGAETVRDIYDYMEALSRFEGGDTTTVGYLRAGKGGRDIEPAFHEAQIRFHGPKSPLH